MSKNPLVLNVSTSVRLSLELAEARVASCSAVWVEFKSTIRNVRDEAEMIALRNQQAAKAERQEPTELFGLRYQPSLSAVASWPREQGMALQATTLLKVIAMRKQHAAREQANPVARMAGL